jgi:hypothetical protein
MSAQPRVLTYGHFCIPGADCKVIPVQSRELETLEIPEGTLKSEFYEVVELMVDIDGEEVALESEKLNRSKPHFVGLVLSRDELVTKLQEDLQMPKKRVEEMLQDGVKKYVLAGCSKMFGRAGRLDLNAILPLMPEILDEIVIVDPSKVNAAAAADEPTTV